MGMISEFKTFIQRGNVIDLAVGVVIGGAFGGIVNSMVNDIIMPPIGYILQGVEFKDLEIVLQRDAENVVTSAIRYGMFLQAVISFLITAFAIFMFVKAYNRLKAKEDAAPEVPAAPPAPTREEVLLAEIRDLLKK